MPKARMPRHILTDPQWLHFQLSAGEVHDSTMLDTVLDGADKTLHDEQGAAMEWPIKLAVSVRLETCDPRPATCL